MANVHVSFTGDASGLVAAKAEAQGAIDSLHGKTIEGLAGGLAGASAQAGALRDNLGRAGAAADKAGHSGRGLGAEFQRAGGHVGRMANEAERAGRAVTQMRAGVSSVAAIGAGASAAGQGMRELEAGTTRAHASIGALGSGVSTVRAIGSGATSAGRGMRELESGASKAGVAVRNIVPSGGVGGRAVKNAIIDMKKLSDGTFGVAEGMRAIESAAKSAGKAAGSGAGFSWAGVDPSTIRSPGFSRGEARDAYGRRIGSGGSGGAGAAGGVGGKAWDDLLRERAQMPKESGSFIDLDGPKDGYGRRTGSRVGAAEAMSQRAAGSASDRLAAMHAEAKGLDEVGESAGRAGGKMAGSLLPSMSRLSNLGWTAVAAVGAAAGTLSSATEHSVAMGKATAGLGMNLQGMENMLARVEQRTARGQGLNLSAQDAELRQSARNMTSELAPAIRSTVGAVGAMEKAKMGAWGDLGPQIKGFADTVKANAPGLQSMMTSLGATALNLGSDTVAGLAQSAPAWQKASNAVAANGPQITSMVTQVSRGFAEATQVGSDLAGGAQSIGDTGIRNLDRMLGARRDPSTGLLSSIGHWGDYTLDGPKPGSQAAAGEAGRVGVTAAEPAGPKAAPYHPSKDADWSQGMSARQIYEAQFQKATGGYSSTGPMPSGLGAPPPRVGPGSSGGTMAPLAAASLGYGGPVLQDMTRSMAGQVAGGGGATGAGMVQHIQKAVNVAAPAAAAGGASIGAAMNTGMAQGSNTTQTVIDTVTIKHSKRIIDIAKEALGVHSPSTEFDWIGEMTWAGFGRGQKRASRAAFGDMGASMGGMLASAQNQAHKFGYDYQDGGPPTVSYNPFRMSHPDDDPAKAAADRKAAFGTDQNQYKPGTEGWWSAHDNRAAQLAAARENRQRAAIGGMTHDERRDQLLRNRAGLHERALANLGVSGHAKPSGDVNPFAAEQARSRGLNAVINPFSQLPGMLNKSGQNSALGLSQGLSAHVGKIQASGAALAGAGHAGYKKKDKQASPSAAWGEMADNSVAGAVNNLNAGAPALASAAAGLAGSMQTAAQGPMSDSGLQVGSTWSKNVVTGAQSQLKTANFQAGTPDVDNEAVRTALAGIGALSGYGGASVYKNPVVGFDGSGAVAALTAAITTATSQPQPIHLHLSLDGQPFRDLVTEGGNQMLEVLLNALTGANG